MTSDMESMGTNEGGRVSELRATYLAACREHNTEAAHRALAKLHELTGAYCAWERHIDGGH